MDWEFGRGLASHLPCSMWFRLGFLSHRQLVAGLGCKSKKTGLPCLMEWLDVWTPLDPFLHSVLRASSCVLSSRVVGCLMQKFRALRAEAPSHLQGQARNCHSSSRSESLQASPFKSPTFKSPRTWAIFNLPLGVSDLGTQVSSSSLQRPTPLYCRF